MTYVQHPAVARLMEIADNPDAYVAAWKAANRRKVIGLFPMNFPTEIAHASGALPVLVQEHRAPITVGNNLLTEFHCGYTRSIADRAGKNELFLYDGFMLADHCIQLLGAVDVIRDETPKIPVFFGQLISSMREPWSREQIEGQMRSFAKEFAAFTGRDIHDEDLARSIAIFNESRRLLRLLFDRRRAGASTFTPGQMQAFIKSSMVMDREEHTALLRQIVDLDSTAVAADGRIKLHLSAHLCHAPKPELLELIEECGAVVVDDDLFHGTRYISTDVSENDPPLTALADWYLNRDKAIPCPTRVKHETDWDSYLIDAMAESGAEGLVVLMAKFCEPHMLYYPELRKALNERGIPHVLIETEHEGMPVETIRTRIEAMLERIRRTKPAYGLELV
jgi:benzoyl-CoA reductase/2-hydroxyglutaryl-CoA dehydratase subunit BcrC/BadD/HgdB